MKRIAICAGIILALAIVAAAGQSAVLKVKVQIANVRSEPDLTAAVITQMKMGTLIESQQKLGEWYEVTFTNAAGVAQTGYIAASTVDVITQAAPARIQEETRPVAAPVPAAAPQVPAGYMPSAPRRGGFKIMGAFGLANLSYSRSADTAEFDNFRKPLTGFGGGIGYESAGALGLEIDLMFLPKGFRIQGSYSGLTVESDVTFTEVSVPVLLKLDLPLGSNLGLKILGGGEIAYVVKAQASYDYSYPAYNYSGSGTEDILKDLNKIDYGLVLGGGINIPLGGFALSIEGRYHLGLANLEKTSNEYEGSVPSDLTPKSTLFLVVAGLKF